MHLNGILLLATLQSGLAGGSARTARDAGAEVEVARRLVEHDSAAAHASVLRARLRRDVHDRGAALGLATIAAYTYDHAAAERAYRALLAPDGQRPDAFAVRARLGLASSARMRGQFLAADSLAAQAAAEAHALADSAAEAAALLNLAAVSARTRGRAARDSALDAAAPLIVAAPSLEAAHRCARAAAGGTGTNSDVELRAGAELARRLGDHRTRGGCLHMLAQFHIARGASRDTPFRLMNEALAEFRAARDRAAAGNVLQYLGWYQTTQGSYGVARINLEAAIRESTAAGDENGIAWASNNLASLAIRTGDPVAASIQIDRAARVFESIGDQPGLAGALALRGDLARATGDLALAQQAYGEALEHQRRLGNNVGVIGLQNGLADLALIESNWDEAKRQLDASRELARTHNLSGWDRGLDSQFGLLALLRGDLDEAARRFSSMLQVAQLPYRRYVTQSRLAEIHARKGEVAQADARLTAAMDTLDRWRAMQSDHDLRLAVFAIQESWADPDLGIATVLNAMAMNGRAEAAFALAERRRARDLLDHLLSADALREEATDSGIPKPRSPAATVAELRAALPDERTAILEFVTGRRGEPTTLFVLTRTRITALSLPPVDSLEAPIARHVAMMESGVDATALSRMLGERLLNAAARELPPAVDRLIIIPDDVLHRVAFDVLLLESGRLAIDRFSISVSPSAATLQQLWARARPAALHPPSLILADPEFARVDVRTEPGAYARAFAEAGGLPRLRYSADEARRVARAVPKATVRTRGNASEVFLRSTALRSYRILHFATHAVVDERTQARTGLALAPSPNHDGFLGPGDLAALDLDADLVVLSACRTAGGMVVRGEGVVGFTSSLIRAGARAVMATGWKVRDQSTAQLVGAFYTSLARGLPAGEALREAKLDALRRRMLPRDWAAFTLVGDPLVRPLPARTR